MAGTWRCRERGRRSRARPPAFAPRALAPVPVRAQEPEPELEPELELEPAPVQAQAREHLPPPRDWKTRVRTRPGGEVDGGRLRAAAAFSVRGGGGGRPEK